MLNSSYFFFLQTWQISFSYVTSLSFLLSFLVVLATTSALCWSSGGCRRCNALLCSPPWTLCHAGFWEVGRHLYYVATEDFCNCFLLILNENNGHRTFLYRQMVKPSQESGGRGGWSSIVFFINRLVVLLWVLHKCNCKWTQRWSSELFSWQNDFP